MTVKELREALAQLPDDMPVVFEGDCQWPFEVEVVKMNSGETFISGTSFMHVPHVLLTGGDD